MPSSLVTARTATTLAYVRPSPMTPTLRTGVRIGEGLPQRAVEARGLDLVDDDPVGLAQGVEPLGGDLADDADREPGPGEGLAHDHRLGQAQLQARPARTSSLKR